MYKGAIKIVENMKLDMSFHTNIKQSTEFCNTEELGIPLLYFMNVLTL